MGAEGLVLAVAGEVEALAGEPDSLGLRVNDVEVDLDAEHAQVVLPVLAHRHPGGAVCLKKGNQLR